MKTVERSFRREAQTGLGAKPRPDLVGPVLTHLRDTLALESFGRPGDLLRIDADALAPATSDDDFVRHAPVAHAKVDLARTARLRHGEASVYAGFLASIPAEESDEEFAAAVDALS